MLNGENLIERCSDFIHRQIIVLVFSRDLSACSVIQ